jgi:hypothetical protein
MAIVKSNSISVNPVGWVTGFLRHGHPATLNRRQRFRPAGFSGKSLSFPEARALHREY